MKKLIVLLFLVISSFANAQDIHFSQTYAAPLYSNPATTGFFNGNYRFTAIYRNQWASVTIPYSTISSSIDFNFTKNKTDLLGVGFLLFSDGAGDSRFVTNMFAMSLAYAKSLDRDKKAYLNFGLQAGYTHSSIDFQHLDFPEEYLNGKLTETFPRTSYGYFDTNLGVEGYYLPSKDLSFQAGFSGFHLNKPILTFVNDPTAIIPIKYIANIGASIPINDIVMYPKVIYSKQWPHQEWVFGSLFRISSEKSNDVTKTFYVGLMDRWAPAPRDTANNVIGSGNDAIIIVTKMVINQWSFHFSYDINTSSLKKASNGFGGPEIAVQYIGKFKHTKPHKIYCPTL